MQTITVTGNVMEVRSENSFLRLGPLYGLTNVLGGAFFLVFPWIVTLTSVFPKAKATMTFGVVVGCTFMGVLFCVTGWLFLREPFSWTTRIDKEAGLVTLRQRTLLGAREPPPIKLTDVSSVGVYFGGANWLDIDFLVNDDLLNKQRLMTLPRRSIAAKQVPPDVWAKAHEIANFLGVPCGG